MSAAKARRIAVRVPSYASAEEEQNDARLLERIEGLVRGAWERVEAGGAFARGDLEILKEAIEKIHRQMRFPDLDVISGEPLNMLEERL